MWNRTGKTVSHEGADLQCMNWRIIRSQRRESRIKEEIRKVRTSQTTTMTMTRNLHAIVEERHIDRIALINAAAEF